MLFRFLGLVHVLGGEIGRGAVIDCCDLRRDVGGRRRRRQRAYRPIAKTAQIAIAVTSSAKGLEYAHFGCQSGSFLQAWRSE